MTVFEMRVLGQLKLGHAHAIPGHLLAKRLELKNDRGIRLAIRSLLKQRQPILSSVRSPMGYFIAETQSEVRECLETLHKRLLEDARRMRDIKLAGRRLLQPEQLKLEV